MEIILLSLGTYWLATAVTKSDGPNLIFARARKRYEFLECFICVSFWSALALYGLSHITMEVVGVLAIAGLATSINAIIESRRV